MPKLLPIYIRRTFLRTLEGAWTRLEGRLNRLALAGSVLRPYNPFYYLGMLAIYLLLVLTLTGIYLTLLYRPGSERAYITVVALSATWVGSLMRSVHRYAADALIVVIFLHALKMWISDRFWGSRWLAWVSGWVLLATCWLLGTMGYFLVWDRAAQWLTEYAINLLHGVFAFSFLGPESAARTFSFFVIILFLHIFVPLLLVVGILVHVLRLARARYWAPRWLMVEATGVLILLWLWQPALSGPPANLRQIIDSVQLDWWYMGFLPLASQLGAPLFWGSSLLVLGGVLALPWLWRGQHEGPATVLPARCTGCALCARECPYTAIEMVHRDDESSFSTIALVKPHLCTGCGVCVGACADAAIELARLPSPVIRQDLHRTLRQAQQQGRPAITVYTCDRHVALGTLPSLLNTTLPDMLGLGTDGQLPLMQAKLAPRVNLGLWQDNQGHQHTVITCIVPCMGILHPQWAAETLEAGGRGAIMVTCPTGDCAYREGPQWVEERLKRRRTLRKSNIALLELAPGSRRELLAVWNEMISGQNSTIPNTAPIAPDRLPAPGSGPKSAWVVQLRRLTPGFMLLLLVFWVSLLLDQPASAALPQQAQLRLVINHSGKLMATANNLAPEVLAKLPKNIDPSMVLGGERFPIQIQLTVDGQPVLDRRYRPSGLRREGTSYGLEMWWLAPGVHQVKITLMDDGATWQTVFERQLDIVAGEAKILYYDPEQGVFVVRETP